MQRGRTLIIHRSIFVKVVTFTLAISCPYKGQKGRQDSNEKAT